MVLACFWDRSVGREMPSRWPVIYVGGPLDGNSSTWRGGYELRIVDESMRGYHRYGDLKIRWFHTPYGPRFFCLVATYLGRDSCDY